MQTQTFLVTVSGQSSLPGSSGFCKLLQVRGYDALLRVHLEARAKGYKMVTYMEP